MIPEWCEAIVAWAHNDSDRIRWVLSWLSLAEPAHVPLLCELTNQLEADPSLTHELRASVEALLYSARQTPLSYQAQATLREHIQRLAKDDDAWREHARALLDRASAA